MCKRLVIAMSIALLLTLRAVAVPKPHVVAFGKWTSAKWYVGPDEKKALELKIRPLYVDTRLKEYTTGAAHEVTDRLFVVRRVFRLNDALPTEPSAAARWVWQRGGWLLVDRVTGRVTQLTLPDFDPFYSTLGGTATISPTAASPTMAKALRHCRRTWPAQGHPPQTARRARRRRPARLRMPRPRLATATLASHLRTRRHTEAHVLRSGPCCGCGERCR